MAFRESVFSESELVLSNTDFSTVSVGNTELGILYARVLANIDSEHSINGDLLHFHSCYELFYCDYAEKYINTENGTLVLHRDDVCIIPPGILHCRSNKAEVSDFDGISFNIFRKQVSDLDTFSLLSHIVKAEEILVFRSEVRACELLRRVIEYVENGNIELADILFSASLLSLPGNGSKTERVGTHIHDPLLLNRIGELVYNYSEKGITLRESALKLGISERHLSRLIKQQYGSGFKSFTLKIRLELAQRLLVTTSLPASEIGTRVGFSDKDGFYRAFKKHIGMTVGEYREKYRQNE